MLRGHKGDYVQVLFVCTHGISRSATGAELGVKLFGWNTRACGTNVTQSLIPINKDLVKWADKIYCFEAKHVPIITELGGTNVTNLNIPNDYRFRQPELIELIMHKLVKDAS